MILITNIILVVIGLLTTLFIPGFIVIELFFRRMKFYLKMPLYIIISLLASVNTIYLMSLIFGFGRHTILILYFLLAFPFVYLVGTRKNLFVANMRKYFVILLLASLTGVIFFIPLNRGFFTKLDSGYILSSPNWQDTAMHLGIIESLTQGNFPPQAPYYSGHALSYYYFVDFHAAIINIMWGEFFPRVIVLMNPIFSSVMVLSMFALVYDLTRRKLLSWTISFATPFLGNYMFIRFINDLKELEAINKETVIALLSKVYSMEYDGLFQVSTMADYFLQNRPMMVGLMALALVVILTINTQKTKNLKYAMLTAVITSLLFKFQLFALLCSVVVFIVGSLTYFEKKNINVWLKLNFTYLIFLLPISLLLYFATQINDFSSVDLKVVLSAAFRWGSWDMEKSLIWHLNFLVANIGVPLILFLLLTVVYSIRLIKKRPREKSLEVLIITTILFLTIPNILSFTIYKGDMFKFFYMAEIALLASLAVGANVLFRNQRRVWILLCPVLLLSTITSLLTLTGSYFNKNWAYSDDDMSAGFWIREYTPQRSVFISYPSVHSPVAQIGGRLRILSYINWPHSHGFNRGDDNVFVRVEDVDTFYNSTKNDERINILNKYNVDYVFLGSLERVNYPLAAKLLDSSPFLTKEYYNSSIAIYRYVK